MKLNDRITVLISWCCILIMALFSATSCTKDKGKSPANGTFTETNACDTVVYTYSADVKTIITNDCIGCHAAGSPYGNLADYLHVQAKALDGSIIGSLKGQGYALMPPTGRLSDCEIKGIQNWVSAGANNN